MARNFIARFTFSVLDEASAKVKKIQDSFDKLKTNLDGIQKSVQLSADLFRVSDQAFQMSQNIFSALQSPIEAAANLEAQMSRVAAVSGATSSELATLKDVAVQLGSSTIFTAVEVAQAEEELAKLGLTAVESSNAVSGVLSAAAAEKMSIADAATIVGTALKAFSLDMSQATYVADVLAKAAATSSTDIISLGESFKYVGPVAKGLGVPLHEVVAGLQGLSDFGITGSKAGNSLQNFYTILAKFKKISQDSAGNLLPLDDALANLEERLKGFSDLDRVAILKDNKMFGDIAGDAALALLASRKTGQLQDRIDGLKTSLGASAEMARVANDNLRGASEQMSGAMDSLKIAIGDPLLAPLKKAALYVADVVSRFSEWAKQNPGTVRALNIMLGSVGALVAAFGALTFAAGAFIAIVSAPAVIKALYSFAKSLAIISASSWGPIIAFAEWALILAGVAALLYSIYKLLQHFGLIDSFDFIDQLEGYFSNAAKGIDLNNPFGKGISTPATNPIYNQDSLPLFKNRSLVTDGNIERQTGLIRLQIESDKKVKTKQITSKGLDLQVDSGLLMGGF